MFRKHSFSEWSLCVIARPGKPRLSRAACAQGFLYGPCAAGGVARLRGAAARVVGRFGGRLPARGVMGELAFAGRQNTPTNFWEILLRLVYFALTMQLDLRVRLLYLCHRVFGGLAYRRELSRIRREYHRNMA